MCNMSNMELSVHFFLQLAFILVMCRVVGLAAQKLGQPQVVGEMIAGVLMGPSLFGWLLPEMQRWVFPPESMSILYAVNQIGLVLYMFVIGLEFQVDLIQQRLRSAVAISLTGILAPLTLGGLLAWLLHGDMGLFGPNVATWQAMLFLGAAMSVTAFPVLSRILYERGLTGSALGTLALAAGSIDDAVAWCLLAVLLATFGSNAGVAVAAIGGGALYVAGVLLIGQPLLRRLGAHAERSRRVSGPMLAFVLILVMLGAWYTDTVGIHAVFGAFILGVAMPRGRFAHELRRMIEPVSVNVLLPLFFIYSGLNTRLGLVDTPFLWLLTLIVVLCACLGKGVACWLAARASGERQRESLALGTLMNARGLMELILLNIGLSRGVITPTLFTMMVLMAIVTTLIAAPLFELAYGRRHKRGAAVAPQPAVDGMPAPLFEREQQPIEAM
jgi:Kef-type K+ transport system membrane component KefB